MKKFFMIAVMAVAALSANAQYAPAKGDFSFAVKFNPFATGSSNDLNTFESTQKYAVSGRYMFSNHDALRLTLGFGFDKVSDSDDIQATVKESLTPNKETRKETTYGITAGYERHFAANKRIDLYAGAQVGIDFTSTRFEDYKSSSATVEGVYTDTYEWLQTEKQGTTAFNAGVFTGINFYVYKKLFLGAEIGFNYKHAYNDDTEWEFPNANTIITKHNETTTNLGFNVEPTLLLGWTF